MAIGNFFECLLLGCQYSWLATFLFIPMATIFLYRTITVLQLQGSSSGVRSRGFVGPQMVERAFPCGCDLFWLFVW